MIDGGIRDAEYILREDFPVFSRYVTPQDCVPRWELLAHGDVTIVMGGVRVAPGDWIVGDRDGLVVVPAEQVEEILGEAEEKVATESEIRDAVRERDAAARRLRALRHLLTPRPVVPLNPGWSARRSRP